MGERTDEGGTSSTPRGLARAHCVRWLGVVTLLGSAVGVVAGPAPAEAANATSLRRYPYLTDLVLDGVTVNFGTDRSQTTATVRYGPSPTCTAFTKAASRTSITVAGEPQYQWKANLGGLAADTDYCYRVQLGGTDLLGTDASPVFRSQLALGATTPYSFAVLGDWGGVDSAGNNPDQARLMQQIASSGVRFAVTTGDTAYQSGSQTNYGDLVHVGADTSTIFGRAFWPVAGASVPLFNSQGNHGFNATSLLTWPQDRAVASSAGRYRMDTYCCTNGSASASYPSSWYAFDAGSARFYVLTAAWSSTNVGTADDYRNDFDNHWSPSAAQRQWLEQDLAAHPGGLKFAFFHYPMYSDNATEPSSTWLRGVDSLEGLLAANGVAIGFNGHAHMYQRNLRPAGGIVTYLTGGGGAKLEPIGGKGCSSTDAYGIGWSYSSNKGSRCGAAPVPTSISQVFHFLKVTVDGTQVTVTPTDSMGRAFDVQTYVFAPEVPPPPAAPTGLAATAGDGIVSLSWSTQPSLTYAVRRSTTSGGPYTTIATGLTAGSYDDATVVNGTTYAYVVAATGVGGTGPDSTEVTATPSVPPQRTVVFSDGFETGDLSRWTTKGGLVVQQAVVEEGAWAARGVTTNGGTYAKATLAQGLTDSAFAASFRLAAGSPSQVNVLRYRTSTDASIGYVYVTTAGQLALRNDVGAVTRVSTVLVDPDVWHRLEFRLVVAGGGSVATVLLDGTVVPELSGTAQNWGTTAIGRVQIGEVQSGRTYDLAFDRVSVTRP